MKIRIDPCDTLYSKIIRKERPICECCRINSSTQVHHYFGRGKKSVRFDDKNIWSVCFTCHRKFEEDPEFSKMMMLRRLGEKEYNNLCLKSNMISKLDRKMLMIYLKQRDKMFHQKERSCI
jgi:hypothetical protein